MSDQFDLLCNQWQLLIEDASTSPRLLLLKQFRDDLMCLPGLSQDLLNDYSSVLNHHYPSLRIKDIFHHVSKDLQYKLGDPPQPSSESTRLLDALHLDSNMRGFFRSIGPLHPGWRSWRDRQIQRFHREDMTSRESHIMYIPFAVELTQGCSGGCSFCGLSADYLEPANTTFVDVRSSFEEFLLHMKAVHGGFGRCGVLYWASDPLDCPDYIDFGNLFQDIFHVWPATTTALAEKYPSRFRDLLNTNALRRPWGVRCSLRNLRAYLRIHELVTPLERFSIGFIPQFRVNSQSQANAGRLYSSISESSEQKPGGTIACMAGLLVNLPQKSIELITPCLAEPNHPNGYRSLFHFDMDHNDQLSSYTSRILSQLPTITTKLSSKLSVVIHPSQFHLYEQNYMPKVLTILSESPLSLNQLIKKLSQSDDQARIILYCLELIQHGVIRSAN